MTSHTETTKESVRAAELAVGPELSPSPNAYISAVLGAVGFKPSDRNMRALPTWRHPSGATVSCVSFSPYAGYGIYGVDSSDQGWQGCSSVSFEDSPPLLHADLAQLRRTASYAVRVSTRAAVR